MATVRFLGSGDAVASGGRLPACILVSVGAERVLLDCGPGVVAGLKRAGIDPSSIGTIAISHLHGDHFAGIPFLVLDAQLAHRARPLIVVGPRAVEERVRAAMVAMYPGFATERLRFPLSFVEIGDRERRDVGALTLRAWSVPHDPLANPLALRLEIGELRVGYSGDTAWMPVLGEVADGADLFICEAQTMAPKARIHVSYAEVHAHRAELCAKRIILTHLGADVIAAASLELERASDGLALELQRVPRKPSLPRLVAAAAFAQLVLPP